MREEGGGREGKKRGREEGGGEGGGEERREGGRVGGGEGRERGRERGGGRREGEEGGISSYSKEHVVCVFFLNGGEVRSVQGGGHYYGGVADGEGTNWSINFRK